MTETTRGEAFRAGFFRTVPQAEQAIRELLAAGFTHQQLAVICPERFKNQLRPNIPQAEAPGEHAATDVIGGGVAGGALGGIALAATAITTGGTALIPAALVFLGGGAIAGGFSSLILQDGYGKGIGIYYPEAIERGEIVVGVYFQTEGDRKIAEAERILTAAGADVLVPVTEPAT